MSNLPPLPGSLKPIQHYLKTASEHDKRDPIVSYYCELLKQYVATENREGRLYAMQQGMEIDKSSKEAKTFLFSLMDQLEKTKTQLHDNEAINNEVVGQAHMENYALKVFLFADNEDRASRFNKNVVKSFYTAGMLFDVLGCFGEISEEIQKNRKYAKWKAAYIHKCLKNGETPVPGPIAGEDDEDNMQPGPSYASQSMPSPGNQQPQVGAFAPPTTPQDIPQQPPKQPSPSHSFNQPAPSQSYNQPYPSSSPAQTVVGAATWTPPANPTAIPLSSTEYQRAMKLCKFASSALQYEDADTAVTNLTKALRLLTTGKES